MYANRPIKKIKKNDLVMVRSGANKGKTGKVLSVNNKGQTVLIDGIGLVKRHIKPSQINPRGGTKDIHVGLPVSKVTFVVDEKTNKTTRVGFITSKEGAKTRVARSLKNKEIK
ncbi:ribosomal protein L24 [candidate division TM7 genomosp. GTL1]|nr:ribosomal protein L24 [candidate division TM7 genomosp. GTL1]